jgi:hypothetical protein
MKIITGGTMGKRVGQLGCLACATLLLTACSGGGGGSSSSGGNTAASTIQGQAIKGPFKKSGTVTATQIGGPGRIVGVINDDTGDYSLSVPWSGPTKIEARGRYTDEFTGLPSQTEKLSTSPLKVF